MKPYIKREKYSYAISPFINKELIKVFIGQRRVGKSYILFQTIDEIKKLEKNPHIIYINKELNEFSSIISGQLLYDYVKSKSKNEKMNYLFIDEIQTIDGFENGIKSLVAEGGYDIYCTGSNANLLSGELSTLLSGRYIEIPIFALSYEEFLLFHKLSDKQKSLDLYLKYGGLPYLKNLPLNDEVIFDYLRNIYQAILFRDIVARFNIRNVEFLERLILFLANHSGTIVSANSISKFLKSQNLNYSVSAIISYLDHFTNAFLVNKVPRSDIQGKKVFEIGEKYYFTDLGLRNAIAGFKPFDLGLIIENTVFNNLKYNGYNVKVGQSGNKEIDFIAEQNGERLYIQVALRITEESTKEREFGNLHAIKDNYPKFVVTLDEYEGASEQGIKHIPLRNFLKKNSYL